MTSLVCWNCGVDLAHVPLPISRHATCDACFNELHCCRLCRHNDPDQTTQCLEDRADPPLQKENANFCEFFNPREGAFVESSSHSSRNARDELDALFDNTPAGPEIESHPSQDASTPARTEQDLSQAEVSKRKLDDLFK